MTAESLITIGVSALVSLCIGFGGSYIAFRVLLERFIARIDEREKHIDDWRRQITADVETLKKSANVTELALIRQSLDALKTKLDEAWDYATELKHVYVDPYLRETDKLKQRIDEIDRRLPRDVR